MRLLFHGATDVDDVVGDDAEAHPAVHSDVALVSAAVEAVSPFDDADASLASGAPLRLCGGFILGGIECGVRRYQTFLARFIQLSRRSLTSSAINPSPKLSCLRRISIMRL